MNNFIQSSLPVLTRLMRVVLIVVLASATLSTIGILGDEWGGELSSAYLYAGVAAFYLLIVIFAIEAVRRTLRYIFFGEKFFSGRPDLILKIFLAIPALLFAAAIILTPFSLWAGAQEEEERIAQLKTRYAAAQAALPAAEERLQQCQENTKASQQRQCTLTRDKVKADYDFCMSLTAINTHATCIYNHDYTKYDCSDEAQSRVTLGSLYSCSTERDTVNSLKKTIGEYESL